MFLVRQVRQVSLATWGLTESDLKMYATNVARGYTAGGFKRGQRLVVGFNAGPFVAGAVYSGFDKIGASVYPRWDGEHRTNGDRDSEAEGDWNQLYTFLWLVPD